MGVEGMPAKFSTLKAVKLRKAWENEARDFTPWLADNLDRLSGELGIEKLELEGTEVQVGPLRADIVARIPQDDARVLIENQLEDANLQHLGQVLAYLAGLEAQIVIWVARGFHEAHLSAIRWLNEHAADPFAFFAVRVRVVQIEDSPMVPIFDVLERPNEWDRRVQAARSGLSELGEFCREFWGYYAERHPEDGVRSGHAGTNVYYEIEEVGLRVSQYLARASKGVGIYIALHTRDGRPKEEVGEMRRGYEDLIRKALKVEGDAELSFLSLDPGERSNWPQVADWLHDRLDVYRDALLGKFGTPSADVTEG